MRVTVLVSWCARDNYSVVPAESGQSLLSDHWLNLGMWVLSVWNDSKPTGFTTVFARGEVCIALESFSH